MKVETAPKIDHTPAQLDEASRVLLKAADLIEERGLAKYTVLNERGSMCIRGAIAAANGGDTTKSGIGLMRTGWKGCANLADERVCASIGGDDSIGSVPRWNNAPERTQSEVVSKLRAVALGG